MIRIDWHTRYQRRYDADITLPIRRGVIDRDRNFDIEAPPPRFEFPPIADIGRSPRAVEHDDPAVAVPMGEHVIDYRAQRCEAEAACHDDDIAAVAIEDGPIRAIRSAHANDVIAAEPGDRLTDGADCPHRVHDPVTFGRISTEADRYFAEPEHIKHVELAGDEAEGGSGRQLEGCYTRHLTADATDTNRRRHDAVA